MAFKNSNGRTIKQDVEAQKQAMTTFVNKTLPEHIADEMIQEFQVKSFDQEKYPDAKSSKWQGRKSKSKKNEGKGLLRQTGAMRNSIDTEITQTPEGPVIKLQAGEGLAGFNYASVHNEGERAGRGKGFQMPKRQFMPIQGEPLPEDLQWEIDNFIDNHIEKILG